MKAAMIGIALFAVTAARADVWMGELSKNACTRQAGKEFKTELRNAYSDKSIEVTHEKEGKCGEFAYFIGGKKRKHWALFPTEKGCQCYLKTAKVLEPEK